MSFSYSTQFVECFTHSGYQIVSLVIAIKVKFINLTRARYVYLSYSVAGIPRRAWTRRESRSEGTICKLLFIVLFKKHKQRILKAGIFQPSSQVPLCPPQKQGK